MRDQREAGQTMTDITSYDAIVRRAEILATSTDWERSAAEFQVLEERLKALGPPADPSERQRVWTRFDGARRRFNSVRAASTPPAPAQADALPAVPSQLSRETIALRPPASVGPSRSADRGFFGNAFVGYLRPFSFRRSDTRRQFWTFGLVGLPLGAGLIALLSLPLLDLVTLLILGLPVLLLACWWALSLIAASARRLRDARLPRAIAAGWLLIPMAFLLALIVAMWLSCTEAQGGIGSIEVFEGRWALFGTIATGAAAAIAAGILFGCAVPSRAGPADYAHETGGDTRADGSTAPAPETQGGLDWRLVPRNAFRGYVRTFRFRSLESRAEYWSFLLVGIPIGAAAIVLFQRWFSSWIVEVVTIVPTMLLALWWLVSLIAATGRRLKDAGASRELALILPWLPLSFAINMTAGIVLTTSKPGQSWDQVPLIAGIWAIITLLNPLIACALPANRIKQWGHGVGALGLFSLLPAALPLLIVGSILALVAGVGSSSETKAKVSASTRRGPDGRTQRVQQYQRRTGRFSQSFRGSVSTGLSKVLGLGAVAVFVVLPLMVWRIELVKQPKGPASRG